MKARLIFRTQCSVLLLMFMALLSLGCGAIGKKKQPDFLKPFSSLGASNTPAHSQPMPSDYILCVETGKTVAAQGHVVEAIKLYERAESLEPTTASLDSQLAPLYASIGNYPAAIKRYQQCVNHAPEDIDLCNNFAWTLMEARHFAEALAEASRGLKIDSRNTRLQATLAMIHYRQGNTDKALEGFANAHGSTAAHHNLSLLEIESGNLESAKTHLRIANQSNQPNEQSEILLTALEMQTSSER